MDSNISRWVAFLLAPVAGAIALKANQWFGIDLDPAEIISFVLGGFALIGVWLHNRGKYEIAERLNVDPKLLDYAVGEALKRIPPAPTAPQAPVDPGLGAPAAPQAPPLGDPAMPPAPGGTSAGQ